MCGPPILAVMTTPRPSRTLYIVLSALLVLLPLLAVLQYRWIGEVSQAERRQLEDHLNQAGTQFAQDFNRELIRILTTFQIRGSLDTANLADVLAQRYDDSIAAYPNFVRRVFVARRKDSGLELLRFEPESRTLEPADWPSEFAALKENLEERGDRFGRQRNGTPWEPLSTGNPLFPVPAMDDQQFLGLFDARLGFDRRARQPDSRGRGPGPMPPVFPGWTLVELNQKIFLDDFIPTVVARHFATGANSEYRIAIVSRGSNPEVLYKSDASFNEEDMKKPDLRVAIFRPDAGRGRPPGGPPQDFQQRKGPRPDQGPGFGPGGGPGPGLGMRSNFFLSGSWELLAQHRSGSLDAQVGSLRLRDLAVSFGILLLLASSVVLVVVSSHRARALAQLQMDFVARVSHELRTPLAIIRSAAYNVANGVVSDENEIREYASMVQAEGQRLSTMVDQILSFSRTEKRRNTYDVRPVQVDEIVERVIQIMSSSLNSAACEINRSIAGNLPKVKADEQALAECLQNLVSNAIKYGCGESARRIDIEARRADTNTVVVTVADHGPGIDAADLPHIFEPFFRGRNVRSDTPGSGLGLNLVRRMINAQGGRVTVESEPGHGTRFTLHLTAVAEAVS